MSKPNSEIVGIFIGERHRWGDTIVADVELRQTNGAAQANSQEDFLDSGPDTISIKGVAQPDELEWHQTYRFWGRWGTYRGRNGSEKQFQFQTFIKSQPHGRAGVTRYLQQAPNIGTQFASKLWEKFQGDAVRILRENPDVAASAVKGLSVEAATEAGEWLTREVRLEAVSIDLVDLLGGRGFPKKVAKDAIQLWGNRAAELIRHNPYLMMAFKGCGFKRTDAMYLSLGHPPGKLKRQALCAWHAIASNTEGHTWFGVDVAVRGIQGNVGGAKIDAPKALLLAKRGKAIATRRDDKNVLWIAEEKKARHEEFLAERIAYMISHPAELWPSPDTIENISPHQREKATLALTKQLSIIGGTPGTGKTYTVANMLRTLVALIGVEKIAVCAPTGKAAVRVTEALSAYRVPLQARTIHSTLGVENKEDGGGGWSFRHNASNPLPVRVIVCDESSMIDTDLCASLFAAAGPGTHVLLVGDIGQLPPVGHGAPLRDMIAAGVPYGELSEIHRNCGTIVRACQQIRDGKPFDTDEYLDIDNLDDPRNLKLVSTSNPKQQIEKMLASINAVGASGMDRVWDCQVLVAVNKRSELARTILNKMLQAELNPGGERAGNNPFFVGDKVVNLKNGFFPAKGDTQPDTDDGKVFVANGELARVIEVAEKFTIVEMLAPKRTVLVPRGTDNDKGEEKDDDETSTNTGCQWDLGYVLSCHKSQGSEWKAVIVMLDEYPGARMVCSREWLYTATSRAKKVCLMIGKKFTAEGMVRRQALHLRKTFLTELIKQEVEKLAQENEAKSPAPTPAPVELPVANSMSGAEV